MNRLETARIDWSNPKKRHIPAFGAIGELGSLVTELKKSLRGGKAYTEGEENLVEEFGDVLWYLAAISSHYRVGLGRHYEDGWIRYRALASAR